MAKEKDLDELENEELEDIEMENNEQEETVPEEDKKEEKKLTWKVSNSQFNNYTEEAIAKPIKKYLDELAEMDPTFRENYKNPERNFDECMIFVINRAFSKKESSDEICYRNAREYYMGEIKPEEYKKKLYDSVSMPTPQKVELTEDEKKALREKAKEEFKEQELKKLKEKQEKAEAKAKEEEAKRIALEKEKKEAEKAAKEEALKQGAFEQMSLFADL